MTEFNWTFCNDCCKFRVLGKGKNPSEVLDLLLADVKRFLVEGKQLLWCLYCLYPLYVIREYSAK
jgi:hypothetical protein